MHYKTPRLLQMTTAQVAQSVEQRTENPRVGGSIPSLSTIYFKALREIAKAFNFCQ